MKLYPFIGRTLMYALPALAGITLIAGSTYINEQQTWRMMANEPQEWLAQSAANAAAQEAPAVNVPVLAPTPEDIAPPANQPASDGTRIAIERDEAPYTIVYNAKRDAVYGTGYLHGVLPQLPDGVFDAVARTGVNRITWQPEPGVRQAIVILPINGGALAGGFAVSGRSLAYTEWQESQLTQRSLLGWLASALGILIISALIAFFRSHRASALQFKS